MATALSLALLKTRFFVRGKGKFEQGGEGLDPKVKEAVLHLKDQASAWSNLPETSFQGT